MKVERLDPAARLGCHGAEVRQGVVERCDLPSMLRLETWAGRVEYLCQLHALEFEDEVRLAIRCGPAEDLCWLCGADATRVYYDWEARRRTLCDEHVDLMEGACREVEAWVKGRTHPPAPSYDFPASE